jgi:bifunctional ADP-heptose synthase (sugar kinase/adenylyltransferase)
LIADEFVYGRIARVSREAPVLILEYDATEIVPGGAGNAANNVASLGGIVRLVSLVGRDEAGRRLFKVLPRAVERAGLSRRPAIARRSRRASSPAAFTRRSSRWCGSIATRASRERRASPRR